jgi:hypothetical protein
MKHISTNVTLTYNKEAKKFKITENKFGTSLINTEHLEEVRDLLNDYIQMDRDGKL